MRFASWSKRVLQGLTLLGCGLVCGWATGQQLIDPTAIEWPTCTSGNQVYNIVTNTCVATGTAANPAGTTGQIQFNNGGTFGALSPSYFLITAPGGNQRVAQNAGTSAAINTLGGSGSLGGVDFASQFGSITSAISDASTYTRGVYDDLGTLGGFTNSLTVPVNVDFPSDIDYAHAGAVFPEQWGAVGDGTTDDHTAIQSCWTYAAAHGLVCEMHPKTSYLITSALSLPSGYNIRGTSPQQGITVNSEVNGDAIILQAGPVVGGKLSNFHLVCDPALANSRGFHIQGSVGGGFSAGGMWNSVWDNVEIDNPAFEGYYSDAGGNSVGGTLPNQFDTFINLTVNGPLQAHPKNLILMTGETIQNTLINGSTQVPNITNFSQYPNPLIELMNATIGLNDGPTNITFLGYTAQEGSICFDATQSFSISFTHGYFEDCTTAATSTATDNLIIQNNNVQNSGTTTAAFVFNGGVIGKLDDSFVENGGGFPLVQFATCSNANFIEMSGNYSSSNIITTSCDTSIVSVPSSGPLVVQTYDTLVNASSTPIQNITYRQNAGERLTLFADGGSITLESGGNINLGGYANPLVIPSGTIVTLKLIDFPANIWLVESANGAQLPQTGIFQTLGGSFPSQFQQISSTNSGLTNGIPAGDNCFISSVSDGSGSNVTNTAFCEDTSLLGGVGIWAIYESQNTPTSSPSYVAGTTSVTTQTPKTSSTLAASTAYADASVQTGTGTFTAGTSDNITVTGATSSSVCAFSSTNATAAASTTIAYVSAVATNTVTISHAATVASGGTVAVLCH